MYDLGLIGFDEPFKKLLNQGMIQGSSRLMYRYLKNELINFNNPIFISKNILDGLIQDNKKTQGEINKILQEIVGGEWIEDHNISWFEFHVDVNIVDGIELNIEAFKKWRPEYANAQFILEDGKYICGVETEKMSKSKYNTINPDELCNKYGADTFRMYEMFLGPIEASKPWDTKGIEGVHRFLKKLWRLFFDEVKGPIWTSSITPSKDEPPLETESNSPLLWRGAGGEVKLKNAEDEVKLKGAEAAVKLKSAEAAATESELKILHRTIKKIEEDTERFSFNTAVSAFMIAVNELTDIKCHKKEILEPLLILLAPYAPHIAEELYQQLRSSKVPSFKEDLEEVSILNAKFPDLDPSHLVESSKEYPISINGKLRTNISMALDLNQQQVEEIVLQNEIVIKWLEGNAPRKIIFVKNKMVNVVV